MFDIKELLTYDRNNPLLFTQYAFWLFFTLFFGIYTLIYKKNPFRKLSLILFGLFFYYKSGGFFFILLLFTTVTDFFLGKAIGNASLTWKRKSFLAFSISINLFLLFYFKYSGFIVENINLIFGTEFKVIDFLAIASNSALDTHFDINQIFLPVGISFFTFQAISYALDIYRKKIKPLTNILDYCFFVTYFPQLLAGPIVRAVDFIPQINKENERSESNFANHQIASYDNLNPQPIKKPSISAEYLTKEAFNKGLFLILAGLFKKIFVSDYISGNFVDRVFENPTLYSGFENLMAVYGYTIQIYCDFSGYTDIAIGLAFWIGFHLPLNFNSPYKSLDITDFWRRWHISLSTWLKDYLYISLGGNRKGKFRQYLNLFITMLLGGLWHGAHLRFIIWGGLHGLALAFHKLWMSIFKIKKSFLILNFIFALITFHFVAFCWIFFRASNLQVVNEMLLQIGNHFNPELIIQVSQGYVKVFSVIFLGYFLHLLPKSVKPWILELFQKTPLFLKSLGVVIFILLIYQVKSSIIQPFIYFQF